MTPHLLVMAKAPVPGKVKTRLGNEIGMSAAAELAAASLADTLVACTAAVGPGRCCLALEGSLEDAVDGPGLQRLLHGWRVLPQRGQGLAERIVNAHADLGRLTGREVVQIGMDTPQVSVDLLAAVIAELRSTDAVLGAADDGGWWVLGVRDPHAVRAINDVPMSTPTTGADTRHALMAAGFSVATTATLRDVDTLPDARHVAELIPDSRFARALDVLLGQ